MNILIKIPQKRTVANPLIGPVPNWYKTRAAITVVRFASIIVVIALLYPASMADFGVFPFLNSSLILSKIMTLESIHIQTVSISPAIPGSVRVAPKEAKTARINIIFHTKAKLAMKPEDL